MADQKVASLAALRAGPKAAMRVVSSAVLKADWTADKWVFQTADCSVA